VIFTHTKLRRAKPSANRLNGFQEAEREWMRRFSALPLREKLLSVEAMADTARFFLERRRARGLPYFDPVSRMLVNGT